MIEERDTRAEVRRGEGKLDEVNPNWYTQVNPLTLDMHDIDNCVLGQVYGDYAHGLSRLWLDDPSRTYGFTTFCEDDLIAWGETADRYWREEIEQRKN